MSLDPVWSSGMCTRVSEKFRQPLIVYLVAIVAVRVNLIDVGPPVGSPGPGNGQSPESSLISPGATGRFG